MRRHSARELRLLLEMSVCLGFQWLCTYDVISGLALAVTTDEGELEACNPGNHVKSLALRASLTKPKHIPQGGKTV